MMPVESSQMDAIGYDPDTKILAIRFKASRKTPDKPGSLYHYNNVTSQMFGDFSKAESKGKFFGAHIKPETVKHPYKKIEEA